MKKITRIDAPYEFKEFYSKYPQGHTIFEAILDWLETLNNVIEDQNELKTIIADFIASFEGDLQNTIINTLEEWEISGRLSDIINEVLFKTKADKDYVEQVFNDYLFKDTNIEMVYKDIYLKNNNEFQTEGGALLKIFEIPRVNKDGTENIWKIKYSYPEKKTLDEIDTSNMALVTNANHQDDGILMKDGDVIAEQKPAMYGNLAWVGHDFKFFERDITPTQIINEGYRNAISTGKVMVKNNIKITDNIYNGWPDFAQRTLIAKVDGDKYLYMQSYGRSMDEKGLNFHTIADYLLVNYNVEFLVALDGGNSVQSKVGELHLTPPSENNGTEYRPREMFLYLEKPNISKKSYDGFNDAIAESVNKLNKEIQYLKRPMVIPENDCNLIDKAGQYYVTRSALNKPNNFLSHRGYIMHLEDFDVNLGINKAQFYLPLVDKVNVNNMGIAWRSFNRETNSWFEWSSVIDSGTASQSAGNISRLTKAGKYYTVSAQGRPFETEGFIEVTVANFQEYPTSKVNIFQEFTSNEIVVRRAIRTGNFNIKPDGETVVTWNDWVTL